MDISVVRIGNSKGISLSKILPEKYNIKDTVELIPEKGYIFADACYCSDDKPVEKLSDQDIS